MEGITSSRIFMKAKKFESYTVYYRVGGTENFSWRRCLPSSSEVAAKTLQAEIVKMGYLALYEVTRVLDIIGLPETYDVNQEIKLNLV